MDKSDLQIRLEYYALHCISANNELIERNFWEYIDKLQSEFVISNSTAYDKLGVEILALLDKWNAKTYNKVKNQLQI